ncbi:MFS transporter [Streptomyces sp. NPDC047706]|uniref:MFS transporter n=1 Tax=Streptomyces sp. NPDC047706 TaxID=3365486 RepID=UPI003722BE3E
MVILDVTIINVAVPVVGRELSASLTGIHWITGGYTLVLAGFLMTAGALGDRLGNRRVFCWGVVVFTLAPPRARSRAAEPTSPTAGMASAQPPNSPRR